MKKIMALVLAAVMVLCCAFTAMAASSKSSKNSSTTKAAAVSVTGAAAANAASGDWAKNTNGTWKLTVAGKPVANTWILAKNPYAGGAAQWYFFDAEGNMVTGWVWIKGADGITRCYYLNPAGDSSNGACYMNGTTPDGYTVDATGAWTVDGKVQTK